MMEIVTYEQFSDITDKNNAVILPLGSFEQHGPAADLGTDAIIADYFANKLSENTGIVKLPVLSYGYSDPHINFPGTVSLSYSLYKELFVQICESKETARFRRIIVVNGHGGNIIPIKEYITDNKNRILWLEWFSVTSNTFFSEKHKSHAGSEELSVLGAINNSLVIANRIENMKISSNTKKRTPARMEDYSENGVLFYADGYNCKKGEAIINYVNQQFLIKTRAFLCGEYNDN